MPGARTKLLLYITSDRLQKHSYLGKTFSNCKSAIFQTKGQSASLSVPADVVRLGEDELIFHQQWWCCSVPVGSHNVVTPVIEQNTKATYHTAFQTILLFLHLLSHDPLCLHSHVALGFSGRCQRVSFFPGESGASGRECGPVTPTERAEQEVTVVPTAGL